VTIFFHIKAKNGFENDQVTGESTGSLRKSLTTAPVMILCGIPRA
jgi:hypothetical protein